MNLRNVSDAVRYSTMRTEELRDSYLIGGLFASGVIKMECFDVDRVIVGSAVPLDTPLTMPTAKEIAADFFCQRREVGVLNIGGAGVVTVDGAAYSLSASDCIYIGRGSKDIIFASDNAAAPAKYYIVSYPAHANYPTAFCRKDKALVENLGSSDGSNTRSIYKYIHPEVIVSCQLVMGITELAPCNVWNTMPPHTHQRRSEVYMYFNMPEDSRVFHLMGPADQTRHLTLSNGQAVVSPAWSIHAGVGTSAYTFCWAMGGENQEFTDMDHLTMEEIR